MLKELFVNTDLHDYGIKNYSVGIVKNRIVENFNYNAHELYDLASITKLFTLNIIYNLEKRNLFSYNDNINKYLDLPHLKNYTILDIIKMRGVIQTDGRLSDCLNKDDFQRCLRTVSLKSLEGNEYTDIGFCLLGNLIEKLTNNDLKTNFEELFNSLGLINTKVLPNTKYSIFGNGNELRLPHDFKTRINGGLTGAAGIFSNVVDLEKYGLLIIDYKIFDRDFIDEILNYNFIDSKDRNRSYAGLYKYNFNKKSYVEFKNSNRTLAHQGYTGSLLLVDFENRIVNVILFDAIENGKKTKNDNFFDGYYYLKDMINKYIFD